MSDTTTPEPEVAFDWCAEAEELRKRLKSVVMGDQIVRGRRRNGEDERETQFSPANVAELKGMLRDAEAKCMMQTTGAPPRRFAITPARPRPLRFY